MRATHICRARVAASPTNNNSRQYLSSACQVPPVRLSFPCAQYTIVQKFAFKYANREWSVDLLLECHVPCPDLPLSSAVCCLSVTATRFSVYACVDLCHERKMNVQHEKKMHVDDHGALEWVTLLQTMVIKVGHVWTEGPPDAKGCHWAPQQSGSTVWGPGKALGGS